jgi:tetratricopeptide (TPR) repeat protein
MRIRMSGLLLIGLACLTTQTGHAQAPTAESYLAEGTRYAEQHQYDRAVDAFTQALRLNPSMAAAHLGLGSMYHNMGRLADAVESLTAAVRLDPQNAIAHLNLGVTLAALRRQDEALFELNEAKRLNPQSARVHAEIGAALDNGFGQMDGALAEFQEAARLDPGKPPVHDSIGFMLMRLGRFSEAIEPLTEALRLDPGYRAARYHVSSAYTQLGRYQDAITSWTTFLELVPGEAEAFNSRAWDYMYVGGQGAAAAADARSFLKTAGWREQSSPFMVLVAHFGSRQSGADARGILDEASARLNTSAWPYPVIAYLRRELTADRLMQTAVTNNDKTEAHAYVGMDLLLNGHVEEARAHFAWVRDYGNKRFVEYALALAELGRM